MIDKDSKAVKNRNDLVKIVGHILHRCKIENRQACPQTDTKKCSGCQKKSPSLFHIFNKFLNSCMWCGEWFCGECLRDSFRIPRLNFAIGKMCTSCMRENSEWEIDSWLDLACSRLNMGMIQQGIALFRMTLNFQNYTESNLIERMISKLNRKPELSVIFLYDALTNLALTKENLRENYLIQFANNLRLIADHQTDTNKIYELNVAAMKTFLIVKNRNSVRRHIDAVKIILNDLYEKTLKQNQVSGFNSKIEQEIHSKIYTQDYQAIIDYLIGCRKTLNVKLAYTVYFDSKNIDSLAEYMQWPFVFARGIFRMFHCDFLSEKIAGFRDVEKAFWNKWTFQPEFLNAYLEIICKKAINAGIPFPFEAVICDYKKNFEKILPARNEFQPVKKRLWPTMILTSRSLKYMKCYEDAIHYNHSHKIMNWSYMKSILSYIDLIDACGSIYEMVFCFLHAASWSLEAMGFCVDQVELFVLSCIVFKCIGDAVSFAHAFFDFTTKSCVFRHAFGSAYYANVFNLDEDNTAMRKYLKLQLFNPALEQCTVCSSFRSYPTEMSAN